MIHHKVIKNQQGIIKKGIFYLEHKNCANSKLIKHRRITFYKRRKKMYLKNAKGKTGVPKKCNSDFLYSFNALKSLQFEVCTWGRI